MSNLWWELALYSGLLCCKIDLSCLATQAARKAQITAACQPNFAVLKVLLSAARVIQAGPLS